MRSALVCGVPAALRLLLIATGLGRGGAEAQVKDLAISLRKRGHDVLVVSLLEPQVLAEELERANIRVVSLRMRRGYPDPRAVFRLARVIRMWRPDLVHSHMVHANLLARITRCFCRIPVLVCTAHSTHEIPTDRLVSEGTTVREIAYRLTDPFADLTTHICGAGAERYVRLRVTPESKMRVIPNGVGLDFPKPGPGTRRALRATLGLGGEFVWLAAGRLERAKDYPTLVNAFRVLGPSGCKLLIAGDGSLRAECQTLIGQLGLGDRVQLLGFRNDLRELMASADAYVMSSAFEGLPLVLIEASSAQLPIVATDVGGNSDVVIHEKTGLLVSPGNVHELAGAMSRIMALSSMERRQLGDCGRKHVEDHFEIEAVVARWEELYREMVSPTAAVVRRARVTFSALGSQPE